MALLAGLTWGNPSAWLDSGAPPAEEIAYERVELHEGEIVLHVRNAVGAPVSIAQVMVDDAFWQFSADPGPELGRFGAATVTIPYPWVQGEPHTIGILTNTGLVWSHGIAVATETPTPTGADLGDYALIGLLVGVVPIAVGMAFFPAMRHAPARWTNALLAFTLGLLAFLAVDTVSEGVELAGDLPGSYHGIGLFFGAALLALLAVLGLERALRARGRPSAAVLALLIAIGIGLHNLGEGLLIGSAFALGSLSLGTALIVGFAVHNVTEGPAVVAPLSRAGRLPAARFLLLAAIAGLPTIVGAWLGAFASYSILPVLFFGLGAGAVVVVLVQVGGAMRREGPLVTPLHMLAFALGYVVMVATGLLTS
ncbi:MAG TPA: metal transporter [Candidatus Thermoplasmatota archaeon]|nr:metal transporter [Candidatus Thermoplasmatota archaeon]